VMTMTWSLMGLRCMAELVCLVYLVYLVVWSTR
jgi:hypothetical protein